MLADLFTTNRVIRIGSQGEPVREVQLALKSIGYALKGTGYFGPATDVAVETFQKQAGLKVDGVVGLQTAKALDQALTGQQQTTSGRQVTASPIQHVPAAEIGRPLWLEAGLRLVGIHEGVGAADNPVIIDWAKEEGGDIAKTYTRDEIPWCSLYIGHCMSLVGIKGTGTLWALDWAGKWPSVRLPGPAVGAVAPMKRTGGGHVILVVGKDQHGNVMGLGGNQHDQVSVVPFPLTRLNQGFWWPDSVKLPNASGMSALPIVRSDGSVSTKES